MISHDLKIWPKHSSNALLDAQAEALAIDILRTERAVTAGQDRTCRVWKIPEESQLVYRPPTQSVDCCRYITSTEWVTGATDGSLQVGGVACRGRIYL